MTMDGPAQPAQRLDRLEGFYTRYRKVVRQYFLKRVHNHAEADDLTHDLLLRIAQRMQREDIENPEAFLFTAAANLLRDRGRHQQIVDRYLADAPAHAENFEALSPERVVVSKQSLEQLLRALKELDPRARDVFILHRLEGMKYADIARLFGLSVSSIEKDIMKALVHIAKYAGLKD
jgi:RNA polymerase sigma-70 factor (ECF subfamily)